MKLQISRLEKKEKKKFLQAKTCTNADISEVRYAILMPGLQMPLSHVSRGHK